MISSFVSKIPNNLIGVYSLTKTALNSMTKSLAVELQESGIRVNAIAPGLIRTKFADVLVDMVEKNPEDNTMIGKPEDVANLAYFLASDEARFINGNIVEITGNPIPSL
jgi:NAD(P)-dependent dehydrogenase (short-subunit alcohol dehydrogenase family)